VFAALDLAKTLQDLHTDVALRFGIVHFLSNLPQHVGRARHN
jgi:hypothetical protein